MKKYLLIITIISFMGIYPSTGYAQKSTHITIENKTTSNVYLQPEDTIGFNKIATGKTIQTLSLTKPEYYRFIDDNSNYHSLFFSPGIDAKIIYDGKDVTISGDNSDINNFIQKNAFNCHTPQEIEPFSTEWINYNEKKIKELYDKLDHSGLSSEFINIHKQYIRFTYLNQLLNTPLMAKMFGRPIADLPTNYYDFLNKLCFNDENILCVPNWFNVMNVAMEEMEKKNIIPVSYQHYMRNYASKIGNDKLRSYFLVALLKHVLNKGYSDDFNAYIEDVKPLITDKDALSNLPILMDKFNVAKEKNKNILRGMKMPEFTANSLDGTEYKLSDYKGKILIIDFWFTGCIPCKAEMPFFDKLAEEMKDQPVQFMSVSLDTGNQLMEAWKKMMAAKDSKSPVLNINIPKGFKSEFAALMNIRSVPRIVLVDKEGYIVDAYAKRPSDPKLKQQINAMLEKAEDTAILNAAIQQIMQTQGSSEREKIINEFTGKYGKKSSAIPALNMMYFYFCQSLANEGKDKELIENINKITSKAFKRDVSYICANTCMENKNIKTAEILAQQATKLTEELNEGKKPEGDELNKYPQILGFYGNLLIIQNRIAEATPYTTKAYEMSDKNNQDINNDYLAILMNQQKYAEAKPFLEIIIRNGMANEKYESWLKQVYKTENNSMSKYAEYLASLKKVYEDELKQQIAKNQLNETAPLFTLKNSDGKNISLADLKGKIVLLDFWATWCGPCKQSFPAMQKVVNKYKNDKEVVVLFIDTWEKNPQAAADFLKNNKYNFTLLYDTEKSEVAKDYKLTGIPAKIIIDKNGMIRYSLKGFSGSEEKNLMELSAMIESLK